MRDKDAQPLNQSKSIYEKLLLSLKGISYGSVEITIHNSQIVQIERKEKVRLDPKEHEESR